MKRCLMVLGIMMYGCMLFSQASSEKPLAPMQTIHLLFKSTVGDSALQTGIGYINAFGEPFAVRAFKYYISDIQLWYSNNSIYKLNIAPHLVSEMDSTSKQISFTAPEGKITSIQFLLGVDSITNTTGVQTGDLDPTKGMYWVWNTGYIMAKLEGTSAVAKTPGRQFTYDIGGYKSGENAARLISLSVPPASYQVTPGARNIIVKADILTWFHGTTDVKISEQPMCHEPGKLAMNIADNYQHMFTITEGDDTDK